MCRDHSLDTVRRNEQQYSIPLKIVSYKDLYGWTMDEIVKQIGTKSNCTFCGVFRRQVSLPAAANVNSGLPVMPLYFSGLSKVYLPAIQCSIGRRL